MDTNAKILNVTAAAIPAPSSVTPGGDFKRGRDARKGEEVARHRLVIEEGPSAGTFVYKTLDSVTGEVIRQLPQEEILKMREGAAYTAGKVIDTSA
ncbi:MAG: flagellar protein FlaG [Brevundimonas sp.]|uniref:flagellar protein FlaG n=1 Tax=Brevundimonas sp. TaxID=1871086 RepID=UPI002735CC86|nr:flagellar protein FlaG [Brevundimonas sp.]MBX9616949.1 flagellar protein FlaG [Caulobacteraceae bacterium]MDP3405634.1 flagellar protein FlaG [Brevundimonas sp.]